MSRSWRRASIAGPISVPKSWIFSGVIGSSAAAQRICPERMYGFPRSIIARSRGAPKKRSGWRRKYWSSGSPPPIRNAAEGVPFLPARPACCQVAIIVPGYPAMMTASRDPISIPSSRAFVDTTHRRSPDFNRSSIIRRSSGRYPAR